MWLLFILLATGLALLMLVLVTVAVVLAAVHAIPWLLIIAGMWLLLKANRDPGRGRRAEPAVRPQARPVPRPVPPPATQQQPSEARPEGGPPCELPIDVQVKVEQIRRKADVLLGYADRFPPFSQDLHIVRQTAAEYLPRTIGAYLELPGDSDPVVAATGKTALQELREQLQFLDSKLDDVGQDLQRHNLDRLLANRRFLEERFRPGERGTLDDPPRQETDAA